MNWTCTGCGNPKPYKTVSGRGWEYCDRCGDMPATVIPDVYWDGTEEHGLADDPKTGKPMVFSSKGEKARYLKEHHLIEAGDKIHGSNPSILREMRDMRDEHVARETALQALATVRQMGGIARREAIQKILKESGRL